MNRENAVIEIRIESKGICEDIEVPVSITVGDFLGALKSIYGLDIELDDMKCCYLKSENPIALLRGSKTLKEFGVHNGTIFNITK